LTITSVKNETRATRLSGLLSSFVSHFTRAIRHEMEAMRERRGSFEVVLTDGQCTVLDEPEGGAACTFRALALDEKLVAGLECTLRTSDAEHLVRVDRLDGSEVTLWSERPVALKDGQAVLVIYPWFLYEKLIKVLEEIDSHRFAVERAMTLFGKLDATSEPRGLVRVHASLNASQRAAVQLCSDSDLSFVWGPPGTGKTTTLAHIVSELLAQGLRVLVLSTTNAALDQALEKIAADPEMGEAIHAGNVVRIGRSDAPTFGAALRDVVIRLNAEHQEALDRLLSRRPALALAVRRCEETLHTLSGADLPYQDSLFGGARPRRPPSHLEEIFSARRAAALQDRSSAELAGLVRRRATRLVLALALYDKAVAERKKALLNKEHDVVDGASLVLCTLTNGYFSPLMAEQRFDVTIVEEASMAILPTLFYAACLGRRKTVIVGDPCQLPSIVQSNEDYVRKVMGRNIFEVAVAEPLSSPLVALLDVQYRMHHLIGELVSDLFYAGRLKHGGDQAARERMAAREPYGGAPLVVLDTAGRTTCQPVSGRQSRINAMTADLCVDLAIRAVRAGADSVAIITPYVEQARAIRARLKEQAGDQGAVRQIECSTVHRFQGQERDVVILDTVDAEPMKPGVLLSERGPHSAAQSLINVAISRARGKLIIVADVRYFEQRAAGSVVNKMVVRALAVGRREILRK
jgi:AAA domain